MKAKRYELLLAFWAWKKQEEMVASFRDIDRRCLAYTYADSALIFHKISFSKKLSFFRK
jgi:hypothetical protein